jgi:hypothetical protein
MVTEYQRLQVLRRWIEYLSNTVPSKFLQAVYLYYDQVVNGENFSLEEIVL